MMVIYSPDSISPLSHQVISINVIRVTKSSFDVIKNSDEKKTATHPLPISSL
jgi:hypothetical protein